jgi:hypothetical protein
VAPDQRRSYAVKLEQLDRLRVFPRRDLDLVTALAQEPNQRPKHQHVRRRSYIHPNSQAANAVAR